MDSDITQPLSRERLDFVLEALTHEGCWYIWDAKGPEHFDCSGLVTYCLERATNGRDKWRLDHNAQRLWNDLSQLAPGESPQAGDLAFYGAAADRISHVMIFMGEGRVFGACGGGRGCVDITTAAHLNAKVRYRPRVEYRPDFRGFRRLPVDLPADPPAPSPAPPKE